MGEYFRPTNIDKMEAVHPHHHDDGLKLGEWYHRNSLTMLTVQGLIEQGIWGDDDEIRAVSDYGRNIHMRGKKTDRKVAWDDVRKNVSTERPVYSLTAEMFPTMAADLAEYYGE